MTSKLEFYTLGYKDGPKIIIMESIIFIII